MRAGAKVGLLAATLAAAVAAVLWSAAGLEPDAGTPLPPPTASSPRPQRAPAPPRRAPKPAPAPDEDIDATPAPRTSTNFDLLGQVVDADSNPVADAVVRALRPDGAAVETKSAADGRFKLSCGPRPRAGSITIGVTATDGRSRAGFLAYELLDDAPDEDDVGPLALEAAVPLVARVVDAAGPVAGARVSIGSFFGTVFSAATTDERGVAKFACSPAADGWLFAYAKGRGRARGEIPEKRDPKVPLVLTLTRRTIRVTVVRTPPDEALAGESVSARIITETDTGQLMSAFVPPIEIAPTAADGATTLEDVALEDGVELRCGASTLPEPAWRAARRPANPVDVEPRVVDARIEFPAGRTVRWAIAVEGAERPADGALVQLRPGRTGALPPGPSHLKVENGDLVGAGFGPGPVTGLAEAPDGAVATVRVDSNLERGPDAVFRRPRRVDVTLLEDGGTPIVGASIALKADDERARPVGDAVETDADGRAAIEGLDPSVGRVAVFESSSTPSDVRKIGVVDVTRGDARLDARLPRARSLTVRVTTDGERRLPAGWTVMVDGAWSDGVEPDESAAELRLRARPHAADRSLYLLLRVEGYRDVMITAPASADVVDAAFDHGVVVLAEVRVGGAVLTPQAWLEAWDETQKTWRPTTQVPFARPNEPSTTRRVERQPPGRYRLRDHATDVTSRSIDLALGDPPGALVLDLSSAGYARGRVLVGDDKPLLGASIVLEEPTTDGATPKYTRSIPSRAMTAADGSFSVVVRGDRTTRVRAVHPLMKRDPERDFADVTGPRDGLTLHLVPGPVLEFSAPAPSAPGGRFVQSTPAVQLFRGAVSGEPAAVLALDQPWLVQTKRRFGGFEPGRYAVWIDPGFGAPLVLPDVELRDGANDLGELRAPRGSSVRVKVTWAADASPRMVHVVVTRAETPTYSRTRMSNDAEIVVDGLGPGRFEVKINAQGLSIQDATRRTVDLDGERDVVVDYAAK
jgi:hypothetical protein